MSESKGWVYILGLGIFICVVGVIKELLLGDNLSNYFENVLIGILVMIAACNYQDDEM